MTNRTIEEAKRYHAATKLRPGQETRQLEGERSQRYPGCPATPLDRNIEMPGVGILDALANEEFDEEIPVDLPRLSQILRSATHCILHSEAREAIEVYVVCSDSPGLTSGVYYLNPVDFELLRLRDGDYRPDLVAAAGDNQSLAAAPATLILGAALVRSYRSILTGTGCTLARILVAASGAGLAASAEMSFVDGLVNQLLGLDGVSEGALCLIPLGRSLDWAEHVGERALPALSHETMPGGTTAACTPDPSTIHRASSLLSNEETRPLRGPCSRLLPAQPDDLRLHFAPRESPPLSELLGTPRDAGATAKGIDLADLSTVLGQATVDLAADFLEGPETSLLDLYLVVHRVNGLESGLYAVHSATSGLRRVRTGSFDIDLKKCVSPGGENPDAAAHIIFTTDFDPVLERFGNRGYRLVLVEAGAISERMALAARSIGAGVSVLPFYDDEMDRFLSPDAGGNTAVLAVELG